MEKVYLVYYDNGQTWEDHRVSVHKVFASKESADICAEEMNIPIKEYKPSVTREEYISNNMAEDIGWSYEDYIENEQYDWSIFRESYYFVCEEELHP